jgi:hypothetical protein
MFRRAVGRSLTTLELAGLVENDRIRRDDLGGGHRVLNRKRDVSSWPDSEVAERPDDFRFWVTPDSLCSPRAFPSLSQSGLVGPRRRDRHDH